MSERFACIDCGISLPPIEPRMFSFNGPHGACPACDGIGARTRIDPARVVPDRKRTLREGAVVGLGPARLALPSRPRSARATQVLGVSPTSLGEAARGRASRRFSSAKPGTPAARRRAPRTTASSRGSSAACTPTASVVRATKPTTATPIDEGRHRRRRSRPLRGDAHLRRLRGPAPPPRSARGQAGREEHRRARRLPLRHVRTFLAGARLSAGQRTARRASAPSPSRCSAR